MSEEAIAKIIEVLEKNNFTEDTLKPKLWKFDMVGCDLINDRPVVGIFINGVLEEEGHGVQKVYGLRNQILAIYEQYRGDGEIQKESPKPEPKQGEVVKPKGDEKMEDKANVTKEPEVALSIDVIKQYICPEATDAEAYNFLQLCHHRGLNPFLKEAYLIKYGKAPATMIVGKDAFTRKAEESGQLDGYEAGIVVLKSDATTIVDRTGTILLEKDKLVGGWAKVYRKDASKPFEIRVGLAEYQKFVDGRPQKNWGTMPATMIRKVALVQALREAFTKELGGCYDAAELDPNADVKLEEAKS